MLAELGEFSLLVLEALAIGIIAVPIIALAAWVLSWGVNAISDMDERSRLRFPDDDRC
jgi:hypothetical protein